MRVGKGGENVLLLRGKAKALRDRVLILKVRGAGVRDTKNLRKKYTSVKQTTTAKR